jgi:hypothetical protein
MKLDPGMHIDLHLVFFGKTSVTVDLSLGRQALLSLTHYVTAPKDRLH